MFEDAVSEQIQKWKNSQSGNIHQLNPEKFVEISK